MQRKSAEAIMLRFGLLILITTIGSIGGCNCQGGSIVGGGGVAAPVIDDVPSTVNDTAFVISGTKTAGTTVWIQFSGEEDAREATSSSDDKGFSLPVDLQLGDNSFVVFATLRDKFSEVVGPFTINVVPGVGAPSLNPVVSPTSSRTQTISGTKEAGASVVLVVGNASEVEVLPENAATTWSYDLVLKEGSNNITVFSRRSDSILASVSVKATILLDSTPPGAPQINAVQSPIGTVEQIITGTRAADGNLCLRRDVEPLCTEVLPQNGETTISVPISLNDGNNTLCFSSVDTIGNQSSEVCLSIDKIQGPAVTVVAPQNNGTVSGGSTTVIVDVVGGPGDGEDVGSVEVCLESVCQTVTSNSDRYTTTIDTSALVEGESYTFTITATNSAGGVTVVEVVTFYSLSGGFLVSNTSAPGHAIEVSIAQGPNGALHVVWADECIQFGVGACPESQAGNEPYDIFYRHFDGTDWDPTVTLISTDVNDGNSRRPAVALTKNGDVHIVWSDTGGINDANAGPADKAVADTDLIYRKLTVAGVLEPVQVLTNNFKGDQSPAMIATGNDALHLVWERVQGTGMTDIYYMRWLGGSWATEVVVASGGNARSPRLAGDSKNAAHVVWQEDDGAVREIRYRLVVGSTPAAATIVVNDVDRKFYTSQARSPSIAIDGGDIAHIVWVDSIDFLKAGALDSDIFYRTYTSQQVPSTTKLISEGSDVGSDTPAIAAGDLGEAVIVWAEPQTAGNADLNLRALSDTIFGDIISPAANPAFSVSPAILSGPDGMVHMVWQDATSAGTADIDRPATAPGGVGPDNDILYVGYPLQ